MDQKHFRNFKNIFKSQTLLEIDISSIFYEKIQETIKIYLSLK